MRIRLSRNPALAVLLALCLIAAADAAWQRPERLFAIVGIAAEIAPVEARLQDPVAKQIRGVTFTTGAIGGARILTVRSGVGKVSAAMAATLLLEHFSPSAVFFSGTAGAIDDQLEPGDVVIGTGVGYHDYGSIAAGGFVRTPTRDYASGRLDPAFFPAGPDLLAAARRAAMNTKTVRVREGLIVTGDAFVSSPEHRAALRRDLKATAVEMEGAAVAQICARFSVPVIVIRSITDRADGSATQSYARFRDTASRNAADLVLATIAELRK